jgi:hypothetical protein
MKKFADEPNFLGLPQSLKGAILGVLLSLVMGLLFSGLSFRSFGTGFLYPGYFVLQLMKPLDVSFMPRLLEGLILFGTPIVPPVLIGVLIFSKREILRFTGFMLFAVYVIAWTFFSFIFHILLD